MTGFETCFYFFALLAILTSVNKMKLLHLSSDHRNKQQ